MHIEKNIYDNIICTLLNISQKSKDHVNAFSDLNEHGNMMVLHPIELGDGQFIEITATIFDMTKEEKDIICSVLKNTKPNIRSNL